MPGRRSESWREFGGEIIQGSKFCSLAPPLGRPFSLVYCQTCPTLAANHIQIAPYLRQKISKRGSINNASSTAQEVQDWAQNAREAVHAILPPLIARTPQLTSSFFLCRSQRIQTGNKVIKPKKASLVRAQTIHKKHTAGLQAVTEKTLAGRAGHLELLRGGKKDRKQSVPGKPTGGVKPKEDKTG